MRRFTFIASAGVLSIAMVAGAAQSVSLRPDQASGTADQINKGKELFAACGGCHGAQGEGKVGTAPRLNSASYLAVVSNEFLASTIKDGRPGTNMIGWGAMYDDDGVDSLVAYIRDWQTKDGVELNASPLGGSAEEGAALFKDICARCHGRSGAGYSEAGSGTGIGRKGFLDQADDALLRGIIKHGKDNTAMRPFDANSPVSVADLTDDQIDGIIKYLRANAW